MKYVSSTDKNRGSRMLSTSRVMVCLFHSLLVFSMQAAATDVEPDYDLAVPLDDRPLEEPLEYPDWFKVSFLDLRDDLQEMIQADKHALVVYFGQRRCPYCEALLKVNFGKPDILGYTLKHFDVVPIDIWGIEEVTDPRGVTLSERDYAVREGTNFTPSLIFYDAEGDIALRLRGYYPPYQFRAALEYVADGHYKKESFRDYLARADPNLSFEPGELIEEPWFSPPPHNLDRSRFAAQRPLLVLFEQGECHACDILHTAPLRDPAVTEQLDQFDVTQLDIWSDEPVITPNGERTTAARWARELNIFYTPSLVFFDKEGVEVIRVDSVVRFFRLRNVLRYVLSEGYRRYPTYQAWRLTSGF